MELPEPLHIKKITLKPPRHTVMICGVAIMTILLGLGTPLRGSSQVPVAFERFSEQMLKQHDVEHVTAYKSGDLLVAEVYLKKESLNKSEYADAKNGKGEISLNGDENAPQYFFTAATYDDLVKVINDAETRFGYSEPDRISISIEAGHESLLSNWFVQCIIMIIMLIIPVLCGYWGYREGKKRTIGPTGGLLLGIFLGPIGLIIVYVTEKIPPPKNGGIRV